MLLVAVKSCFDMMEAGAHDSIRSTWGAALAGKAHLKFFMGRSLALDKSVVSTARNSYTPKNDEIILDCEDTYATLPAKTRGICQWAMGKNLSHTFLCDTDTYVKVGKLLTCGFERYDYVGAINKPIGATFEYTAVSREGMTDYYPACHPWASGGYGYFLSRSAAQEVADTYPKGWAEDMWVAQILGPFFVRGQFMALDLPKGTYSEHFPSHIFKCGYEPKFGWLETMHKANQ
jgi:hypothetical protein